MFVSLIGACPVCSFLCFSRQFIARYVHDLIVKHNVRATLGCLSASALTLIVSAAQAAMGRKGIHQQRRLAYLRYARIVTPLTHLLAFERVHSIADQKKISQR